MSRFGHWLKRRAMREEFDESPIPEDDYKFNRNDDNISVDYEKTQKELFQLVMRKYPTEAMQFLSGIAQRGDEEIQALVRKLDQQKRPVFKEPEHPTDGEEIVPPGADVAHSEE